jgi:choline dehydrogenase-like flavoprotein
MAADRIGRVRIRDWVMDTDASFPGYRDHAMGGHHPIGTTRMARRPEEGVVDPDSRVFGTDNLYMAGSSVFPTMGYANPTLTIVQMTLRLADHLDRLLRRS